MADKNSEQSIMDKSMRSVFVGNIPYEATEEKLKEIFSEVGPVLSLKLVFDRESGKPKGFGFCEYKDQETALSAMRNLNGYEIGGRTLRVDNACTEKSRMEMQQLLQGPQIENPYGEHCDPDQAPEIITKTVASLPPEQMYELMKHMKLCIQNNPSESRQMLMLNPQLAYALLQSMVVMRIVDPQAALGMLFKANQMPPVLGGNPLSGSVQSQSISSNIMQQSQPQPTQPPPLVGGPPMPVPGPNFNVMQGGDIDLRAMSGPALGGPGNMDPRQMDPRMARNIDQDMRAMPNPVPPPHMDPRAQRQMPPQQVNPQPSFPTDPRQRQIDPRLRGNAGGPPGIPGPTMSQQQQTAQQQLQNRLASNCGIPNDATDQEKAALIMQVLQLSDEQISQLPPEQRASILVLKEQIAKSTQR
ncbi:cleavage stimulation factor subunit 2 [Bactrocera neohumeralis]|uniref:cleavage stimulation factor subunit 2 n=1 Tax=Bactrocera tryoni TaxID=59916 RepID=UPI001A97D1EF|nr:cleavage stimulation factor subunit 2 [Bactrocera tryoni]XP_050317473.1 cleavage stimulation factor subunit 2 [Bactrocera neohumeralis]